MEVESLFHSAWLKWGWGTAHAELLKSYVSETTLQIQRERTVIAAQRYDAQRHCIVIVADDVPDIPERFGLILGDAVNGFRSSLDHLAWALVKRGRTPVLTEKKEIQVQFPLALKPEGYTKGLLDSRLPGVRRADLAIVRWAQPYKAGKRNAARHPLTPLAKLARLDKHRTVQPIWVLPLGSRYEVKRARDCVITRIPRYGQIQRLEKGAEIARIYVRRTGAEPSLEMKGGGITVEPFVDEFVMLGDWITKTSQFIAVLLKRFADPPEDLIERIAPDGGEHVFP
jgi:hypothetical protein